MENVIAATFRKPYAHGKNTIILSDYRIQIKSAREILTKKHTTL